jgi:hypothetical protein
LIRQNNGSQQADPLSIKEYVSKAEGIAVTSTVEIKDALTHWIVDANVPLAAVNHKTFQRFIHMPQEVLNTMPQHHSTVKSWLMNDFERARDALKEKLSAAVNRALDARTYS